MSEFVNDSEASRIEAHSLTTGLQYFYFVLLVFLCTVCTILACAHRTIKSGRIQARRGVCAVVSCGCKGDVR